MGGQTKGRVRGNKITIDKGDKSIAYIHIQSRTYGKFRIAIDTEDIDIIKGYTWFIARDKRNFYVRSNYRDANDKRRTIQIHQLIMQTPKDMVTDHIDNTKTLDNRKSNLRIVTNQENCMNKKSHHGSSSKYKGVSFHKRCNKWIAYICLDGKNKHLGLFSSEDDAGRVYNANAIKYFGEHACLNIID